MIELWNGKLDSLACQDIIYLLRPPLPLPLSSLWHPFPFRLSPLPLLSSLSPSSSPPPLLSLTPSLPLSLVPIDLHSKSSSQESISTSTTVTMATVMYTLVMVTVVTLTNTESRTPGGRVKVQHTHLQDTPVQDIAAAIQDILVQGTAVGMEFQDTRNRVLIGEGMRLTRVIVDSIRMEEVAIGKTNRFSFAHNYYTCIP